MICHVRLEYDDAKPVMIKVSVRHRHLAIDAAIRHAVDQGMIKPSMVDKARFVLVSYFK